MIVWVVTLFRTPTDGAIGGIYSSKRKAVHRKQDLEEITHQYKIRLAPWDTVKGVPSTALIARQCQLPGCSKSLPHTRTDGRYCSDACRAKAYRQRWPERIKATRRKKHPETEEEVA